MPRPDESPPLREQIAGLIDAGKAYARAEITYYKLVAAARAKAAAAGVGFALAALLFAQAALTVLLAALGLWVARWLGPAAGLAVAALLGLAVAALLGLVGARRIGRAGETS